MNFLQTLAQHIAASNASQLHRTTFVFPNRRSGLFFRTYLLEQLEDTMWFPEITTINELMQKLSAFDAADRLDLIFSIYDHYKSLIPQSESFDTFYPWAEVILNDFDSLDKYLVDPAAIFKNISELKEIDDRFGGLEEEQIEYIRKFWRSFLGGKESSEKEAFLTTWQILPKLYEKLQAELQEKEEAYEGMLYRRVAEFSPEELATCVGDRHYTFVGFNALSAAEKRVFAQLKKRNQASFYWDYDHEYIRDAAMEAGRFMRENIKQFPPEAQLHCFKNLLEKKEIRIFDLPSDVLQAKLAHQILEEKENSPKDPTDTAIIAADENLLMPILLSIPEKVQEVNITMGYPFRNTPLNSFLEGILRLLNNARYKENSFVGFYHKDVFSILNHHYYRMISGEGSEAIVKEIQKGNYVYVKASAFQDELSKLIFQAVNNSLDFCAYLDTLLKYLAGNFKEQEENDRLKLELEYIYMLLQRLNKLQAQLKGRPLMELKTFLSLFRKLTSSQRIPFTGEPLAGLQLMGILESRLLDFNHVMILSLNEDVMPGTSSGHSFIPYSLRYAYELPVKEDMDAIYAYYFYRVIQRAEKVDLMFNSTSDGVKNGEMSRYLYQMKYQFNASLVRPNLEVHAAEKKIISIEKTPEVLGILGKYLHGNEEGRYLSPSALNALVECPLRFYFQRIAGVRPEEELLEELDPIGFGNIYHNSMQRLYEGFIPEQSALAASDWESLLKSGKIEAVLHEEFRKEYYSKDSKRELEGQNLVIFEIIKKYIYKTIDHDKGLFELSIIELEQEYRHHLHVEEQDVTVAIGGKIDRVDRVNGQVRIIDYKTGKVELQLNSLEALFESEKATRSKEGFQALTYSWLYEELKEGQTVQPGLYALRSLYAKDFDSRFYMGTHSKKVFVDHFEGYKDEFEALLKQLLNDLYNPKLPFTQTTVEKHCKYCDFKKLCQR